MEINYRSQLGRFTCDEWARLGWLAENEVSLASLGTLPRHPANTNAFAYFVSLHKEGALCKDNLLSTSGCSRFAWELALTLKADKVAGLLGLPSDDAQAVLQAQDALNAEMTRLKFLTGSVVHTSHAICHLGEVKVVGVGLLASQTNRDEDDHGSVRRWLAVLR